MKAFNLITIFTFISLATSFSYARTPSSLRIVHPSIVDTVDDSYRYKVIRPGEKLYSDKDYNLVLAGIPEKLGFDERMGVRVVQTRQKDRISKASDSILTLRATFRPNVMIGYDVSQRKLPKWLEEDFMATDIIVPAMSSDGRQQVNFQIFQYTGPKKYINLGGNGNAANMYLIFVRSGPLLMLKN